jgi:DNA repair exonuclease SbcCD nuclease subunit
MDCLSEWMSVRGDIDFVIHGGDVVEYANAENIVSAVKLFEKLPCPVYAVLGNHDLTSHESLNLWLKLAPDLFLGNSVDFPLVSANTVFEFITSHWGNEPYFWATEEPQVPYFLPCQWDRLRSRERHDVSVLVTHAPVFGVPCAQTGMTSPLHSPSGNFSILMQEKLNKSKIKLVLGAHTHMNMCVEVNGVHYVTVSAFSEAPFEFKLFQVTDWKLSMQTVSLAGIAGFRGNYDFDKTFVQGRLCDRFF